jgi:ribokinase
LPPALLAAVDVIVPNEHEARALTGIEIRTPGDAERAARALHALGPRQVIVTLGDQGCLVLSAGKATHVLAERVAAVDTTAAGDAFCGGLAYALASGRDLIGASRLATRAAGLSVTRPGAQASLATRDEVERLTVMAP